MSGMIDRSEIQGWLEEQFAIVEESGAPSIVGMVHHAHSGPNELHTMKAGHGKWANAEQMAITFDSIASRHARGIAGGGGQQYELSIVRGDSSKATAVLPFIRFGAPNLGMGPGGSLATEPPTSTGLTQQAQRWGEQITQLTFGAMEKLQGSQQRAIEQRDSKIEKMEQINAELWIACKGLLLDLDKRRHAERLSELQAARLAEFQKQVMVLAPALINMMAGKEVFALSAADTAILDTVAAWASPDDLRMITAALSSKQGGAELAAVLTERFNRYHERKTAELQAEKKLLAELPDRSYDDAEKDAAGEAVQALRHSVPRVIGSSGDAKGTLGDRVQAVLQAADSSLKGLPAASPEEPPTGSAPAGGASQEDAKLWDDLFATVDPGKIGMLISVLGAEDPALARRLQSRYDLARG